MNMTGTELTVSHEVFANGLTIVRTPTGIGVLFNPASQVEFERGRARFFLIEVWYEGKLLKSDYVPGDWPWRDYYSGIDMLRCVVKVFENGVQLAELGLPDEQYPLPFMVAQGPQQHVTESYVSVPPALTITDNRGDVWTFGFLRAEPEQSPQGEFAFDVLCNGKPTGEIASRIERRGGKVRVFTRHGWRVWNGSFFF
jgi:hypothetical protein